MKHIEIDWDLPVSSASPNRAFAGFRPSSKRGRSLHDARRSIEGGKWAFAAVRSNDRTGAGRRLSGFVHEELQADLPSQFAKHAAEYDFLEVALPFFRYSILFWGDAFEALNQPVCISNFLQKLLRPPLQVTTSGATRPRRLSSDISLAARMTGARASCVSWKSLFSSVSRFSR